MNHGDDEETLVMINGVNTRYMSRFTVKNAHQEVSSKRSECTKKIKVGWTCITNEGRQIGERRVQISI